MPDALVDSGMLISRHSPRMIRAQEVAPGQGAFRHTLAREALYGDITWMRRRAPHCQIAAGLEARAAPPSSLADHWLAGRAPERARRAPRSAADAACAVYAHRDAAQAIRRARDLWSEEEDIGLCMAR